MNQTNKPTSNGIWITWHYAARSRSLAKEFGLTIHELQITFNTFFRHFFSSFWTLWILLKERPNIVFIQYSFLLLIQVAFYKKMSPGKIQIIADCHTKALRRKKEGFLDSFFSYLKKKSFTLVDFSIVSNAGMESDIKKLHSKYFFIPDKIPDIVANIQKELNDRKYCVYVSSLAVDEPFNEIFDVANSLQKDGISLFWSGKKPKQELLTSKETSNIIFTGYLEFSDYYDLIKNADCILALTTEEDCLQSAAYEALAVETPMVVSDTNALRKFFKTSALYTNHDAPEIYNVIKTAIASSDERVREIRKVKEIQNESFNVLISALKKSIYLND